MTSAPQVLMPDKERFRGQAVACQGNWAYFQ